MSSLTPTAEDRAANPELCAEITDLLVDLAHGASPYVPGTAPSRDNEGYYTLPDGTRCMSVTTIIGHGVPKPGLVHWAAIEVARCAVDNVPKLSRLRGEEAREDCYQWLRRAAERKRDTAAELGSAVHDACEAHVLGTPWPTPAPEQRPFLDAFHQFIDDHNPTFHATEMKVANPAERWAGTIDAVVQIPALGPAMVLIDYKSGRSLYDDHALQLSAYRRATVGWLKDGTEVEKIATERAIIVHLRPDVHAEHGGYRLYQVDTSDEVYTSFLTARDLAYGWTRRRKKRAVTLLELDPIPSTGKAF